MDLQLDEDLGTAEDMTGPVTRFTVPVGGLEGPRDSGGVFTGARGVPGKGRGANLVCTEQLLKKRLKMRQMP